MSIAFAVAVAFTFLIAGFVKGVVGLGLPTVSVGLLGLLMTPVEAASLLIVPSLVTNLWQLAPGSRLMPLIRRLWPMCAGIVLGTWVGGGLLLAGPSARATAALGMALMIYAGLALVAWRLRVSATAERWLSPVVGATTGALTAATGVFVVPAVPYLQALALERDDLVQALGLSFTVSTLALAAALAHGEVFQMGAIGASFAALAPAILGMVMGQWIRSRVRPELFRRCLFCGLLVLGGDLILRGMI